MLFGFLYGYRYRNNMPWRKIRSVFDVTMGSFDGAETCELVGLFLLSQLTHLDVNVGLYRDDRIVTCTKNAQASRSNKKEMCRIFKRNSLQITIEANTKGVDFLDITLDLRSEIYHTLLSSLFLLAYLFILDFVYLF